jgi:hypothetical protein
MKRLLQIILTASLLISCNQETRLDGVWYGAYSIIGGKKAPLSETTLFDFRDNQLFTITIRDLSTGDLDKVTIDSAEYKLLNSKLQFKSYSPNIQITKDSLTLEFENHILILGRIPEDLKNLDVKTDCFHGSYFIQSKNYRDSIDFVSDSLLIYTGEYDQNFPGKTWQIVKYGGFKFLNIHEELRPVTIIKSCGPNGIELIYPSIQVIDSKLTPTTSQIDKKQLLGEWTEIENSYPAPPLPPNLTEDDHKLSVEINNDSIKIQKYRRSKTHKWGLTSDGKRIFFMDSFLENEGSWKLLKLTDTSMTVRISSQSGFKEEIVKFEKEKNGR